MSSWGKILNNTSFALALHSSTLARLQEQTATGSRVLRVSDAPVDAYRILDLRAQSASLETYTKNIETVVRNLENVSTVLDSIVNSVASEDPNSVKIVLAQVANGTYNPDQRGPVATAIDTILEQIVSQVNSQFLGQYLFSGSSTKRVPYEVVRDDAGKIIAVNYQGSLDEMLVPVAPGVQQSYTLLGDRVFKSDERGEPIFLGETGAEAGAAVSNICGAVWLLVTHTSTDYTGAAGLAEGTDAGSDTILGDHTLSVDGVAGTIQLDDGVLINFNGTETNLKLTNAAGNVVHVDTTGWSSASGDFTITGNGNFSIDEGATTVAIDFAQQNQAVVDSATNRVLYVDSRNIVRVGVEPVRVPGTYDLFGTLINVRDVLSNTHNLSKKEQGELIGEAMESVQEVVNGLIHAQTSTGAQQYAMGMLHDVDSGIGGALDSFKQALDDQAATLEQADLLQLAIDLARTQTLYEMTLVTASRLLSLSLLDFI